MLNIHIIKIVKHIVIIVYYYIEIMTVLLNSVKNVNKFHTTSINANKIINANKMMIINKSKISRFINLYNYVNICINYISNNLLVKLKNKNYNV